MAKTKSNRLRDSKERSIFSSSGYKGVIRQGSKYSWRYESASGSFSRGGFDSAEEAAYHYDEFLIGHLGGDAVTNQVLGLLKPKAVLAIREKIGKNERPKTKMTNRKVGKSGYKGVNITKNKTNPYTANICFKGKIVYLGGYATAEEAARAFDTFAIKHCDSSFQTNAKLGLLPPIVDPVFIPGAAGKNKVNSNSVAGVNISGAASTSDSVKAEQRNVVSTSFAPSLTPEEERQQQIEAARQMVGEEDEGMMEAETPSVTPSITAAQLQPNTVTVTDAPAKLTLIGEHMPALPGSAADLVQQAAHLLQRAALQEKAELKAQCVKALDDLVTSVQGYQKAAMELIDHGAAIETRLAALRDMLQKV